MKLTFQEFNKDDIVGAVINCLGYSEQDISKDLSKSFILLMLTPTQRGKVYQYLKGLDYATNN